MTEADDSYVMVALGGLALVGLMVQFFFGGETTSDGSSGPASATVWGYGLVALSVACLMFVSFALTNRIQQEHLKQPPVKFAWTLIQQSTPLLLLLVVVAWIAGLNMNYWERINKGEVPAEYNQFATLSSIMTAVEIVLLMKWLNEVTKAANDHSGASGAESREMMKRVAQGNQMRYISYLISIVNMVFAGMMTVVLKYFSTDG